MTQTHPDARPGSATPASPEASQSAPAQVPADSTQSSGDQTSPFWYGRTQELPHTEPAAAPAATPPQSPWAAPTGPGAAPASTHAAYPPLFQPPAGPPPSVPTGNGAEPAQPANRRRWTELTAVAALAAVLATGGTYAATLLGDSQSSSSATSTTLGRGTDKGPVVQADASAPNWTATAAAVAPSVVSITVTSSQGEGQGSGVIIDTKGHILTNNHVVSGAGRGATMTVTLNDGRSYKATVAGTDPSTDLAVITLANPPSDLKAVALGNSDDLKVGDPVMAIGNPLGLAGTVTTGIVSALNRPVTTQAEDDSQSQQDPFGQGLPGQGGQGQGGQGQGQGQGGSDSSQVVTNAIQTSAAINPGNSGGALVNSSGQLVGINSAIASLGSSSGGQSGSIGIGFAIPVNEAKSIATQLIEKGSAQHAFLGVTLQDGTATDGSSQRAGAEVTSVSDGTPAANAGLKKGDVVIAVDGDRVDSSLSLVAGIRERSVGDKVSLTVLRDGKRVDLTTTLVAKATS